MENISTSKDTTLVLKKAKKLLSITDKLLPKTYRFQFWLPTRIERIHSRAVDTKRSIVLNCQVFTTIDLSILLRKFMNLENTICIVKSELIKHIIKNKFVDKKIFSFNEYKTLSNKTYKNSILIGEYTISELKYLQKFIKNLSFSNKDLNIEDIHKLFPNNFIVHLDSPYTVFEIYDFARQFIPYDARANDSTLLDRLKEKNSGADKPFLLTINNFDTEIKFIIDIIDENPTDNIGILFPHLNNAKVLINKYYHALSNNYFCTRYYNGIKIKNIFRIILTTFENLNGIKYDILIIPQFEEVLLWCDENRKMNSRQLFQSICSTQQLIYLLSNKKIKLNGVVTP